MGGGLLANVGTHIIDIITFVTGLKAKRVHGVVKNSSQLKDTINGNDYHAYFYVQSSAIIIWGSMFLKVGSGWGKGCINDENSCNKTII